MEKSFLFCAVIVTLKCAVFGAAADEDRVQTNSERFSRIEETLQKLETENRNLHNVVVKLEATVQTQKIKLEELNEIKKTVLVQQEEINELKHSCRGKPIRTEMAHEESEIRNGTNHDSMPLDKSVEGSFNNERREKSGNQKNHRASRLLAGGIQSPIDTNDVAFYAYMSKTEAIIPHHTLIFDHVETNIGHAYSQHSGAFTVPINGVYILSYTVFPNGAGSYASVELTVNSMPRGTIFIDSQSSDNDFTGCTGFAVLALKQGDVCFVRLNPTYQSTGSIASSSNMRSSFSGIKV
ncbi:Hypothetical predicted protein [Mytilus galloprovincialis]|uniref:C1q domain-containing protein n=1 Tax=Mytilus galloprovincialis TaxID=29158 RepID=A0A8B6GKR8_MYTGA|nr:Hypothetical predicted protein [Mytilus galloprovincialis]